MVLLASKLAWLTEFLCGFHTQILTGQINAISSEHLIRTYWSIALPACSFKSQPTSKVSITDEKTGTVSYAANWFPPNSVELVVTLYKVYIRK